MKKKNEGKIQGYSQSRHCNLSENEKNKKKGYNKNDYKNIFKDNKEKLK